MQTVAYTDDMMPSDDEDQDDAYMRRMKAEGKERVDETLMDDEDDEDESGIVCNDVKMPNSISFVLFYCM